MQRFGLPLAIAADQPQADLDQGRLTGAVMLEVRAFMQAAPEINGDPPTGLADQFPHSGSSHGQTNQRATDRRPPEDS